MVSKLLDMGCSPTIPDKGGLTPALVAANCCCALPMMELLLEKGKLGPQGVRAATYMAKITPLDRASKAGQVAVVKLLLASRAEVNCQRTNGYTPLHSAAEDGRVEVCVALLDGQADPCAQDNDGRSALHVIANRLSLFGQSVEERLSCAKVILAAQANPFCTDKDGRSPFQIASETGFTRFVDTVNKEVQSVDERQL